VGTGLATVRALGSPPARAPRSALSHLPHTAPSPPGPGGRRAGTPGSKKERGRRRRRVAGAPSAARAPGLASRTRPTSPRSRPPPHNNQPPPPRTIVGTKPTLLPSARRARDQARISAGSVTIRGAAAMAARPGGQWRASLQRLATLCRGHSPPLPPWSTGAPTRTRTMAAPAPSAWREAAEGAPPRPSRPHAPTPPSPPPSAPYTTPQKPATSTP